MIKKIIVGLMATSTVAMSSESHNRYVGSVGSFTGTIKGEENMADLIKYAGSLGVQTKLIESAKDGVITADELKASGIQDHHFYTGYLAGATSQSDYDKRLKVLHNGANADDLFVSNRDMKAHGSMIMNQVDAGNKIQNNRIDKVVEGMKDIGNFIQAQTPNLPEVGGSENIYVENSYDDTQVKEDILANTDKIQENTGKIQENADKIAEQEAVIAQNKVELDRIGTGVERNSQRIDSVQKESRSGIAGVAAMSAIDFKALSTGEIGIGAGVGTFKSQQSVAVGIGYAHSDDLNMNVKMAIGDEFVAGAGMVYKFRIN